MTHMVPNVDMLGASYLCGKLGHLHMKILSSLKVHAIKCPNEVYREERGWCCLWNILHRILGRFEYLQGQELGRGKQCSPQTMEGEMSQFWV